MNSDKCATSRFTLDREPRAVFFHSPFRVKRSLKPLGIGFPAGELSIIYYFKKAQVTMKKIIVIIFLVTCLTGCLNYSVKLKDDSNPLKPIFTISQGTIVSKPVQFSSLVIYKKSKDKTEEVWNLNAINSGHPNNVSEITYGIVPSGYKEIEKAKDLEVGFVYKIKIYYGDYCFVPSFEIINESDKYKIQMIPKQ